MSLRVDSRHTLKTLFIEALLTRADARNLVHE